MEHEAVIELSRNPSEFLDCFKDAGTSNLASLMLNGPPAQQAAIRHSAKSLSCGRSLGSAVIYLFGEAHSGKSSTINHIFGEFCSHSKVSDAVPVKTSKHVIFKSKLPAARLGGHLSIVEIPCMFDTLNKNQVRNLATIQNHAGYLPELTSREDFKEAIEPRTSQIKVREKVFPNAVLVFLKATSNRIAEDSRFKKQLDFLQQVPSLIDTENPNLIIIITNCMAWGDNVDSFQRKLDDFTILINDMTKTILGIHGLIVPIENFPEDYDLPKVEGNCYKLPNNDVIPTRLQNSLLKVFKHNKDHIGKVIFREAYELSKNPVGDVQHVDLTFNGGQHEVQVAHEWLTSHNIPVNIGFNADNFHFEKLGFGYCPITEKTKRMIMNMSENEENRRKDMIGKRNFLVPKCVTINPTRNSKVYHSVLNQIEYEQNAIASYEIDPIFKFSVKPDTTFQGWIQPVIDPHTNLVTATYATFTQIFSNGWIKIPAPAVHVANMDFQNDIGQLPALYSEATSADFKAFLDKWGTHLIHELKVGGFITVTYKIPKEITNNGDLQIYQQMVSTDIINLFKTESTNISIHSELQRAGLTLVKVEVVGGDPRELQGKDVEFTSDKLQTWMHTISSCPVELKQTLKLCPFYDMMGPGGQRETLRRATKEYLQEDSDFEVVFGAGVAPPENRWRRQIENLSCFPAGTQVALEGSQGSIAIEHLEFRSDAKLVSYNTNQSLTYASFCTYLHKAPEQHAEFLAFQFSNGRKLVVSEAHLIFEYIIGSNCHLEAKQARYFKIGEMMLFRCADAVLETTQITHISREIHQGIFCPLTTSGKFFADGFLVSSYANVTSFAVADATMTPLKLWSQLQYYSGRVGRKVLMKKNQHDNTSDQTVPIGDGIHPFGKFLMKFRMSEKYLTN